MKTPIKPLTPTAIVPTYATPGSAGFDIASDANLLLRAGEQALVPTGLSMAIPDGYYLRICPRSGLAARNGIDVLAGVIDADYRGEIKVALINHGDQPLWIEQGDRIAQGVVMPVVRVEFQTVEDLGNSLRGFGGFGSTGR